SPDSYRAHFMLGIHLFENGRRGEGEQHFRTALQLFPYDPLMAYSLAEQYRGAGLCKPAIPLFRALFAIVPEASLGHLGLANCLLQTFEFDEARREALAGIRVGASVKSARAIMAAAKQARDSIDARSARGDSMATAVKAAQ